MIIVSKCTQCGGNIEIDSAKKEGRCPYCNAIYINEESKKSETKKPAENPAPSKKKIKPGAIIAVCIILFIQIGCLIGFIMEGKAPLDEILLYKIDTVILDDGRMENTYFIEWKVLNDDKLGPLIDVNIGMPNSNFEIKNFGQDVVEAYPHSDVSSVKEWVKCDLKYAYNAGQIAKIEFTVIQSDMLCYNSNEYFYEFIPAWFDEIEVKSYEFNWAKDDRLSSDNADVETADTLTWKGSLKMSEHRVISVKYNSTSFSEDQTVPYREFDKPPSSGETFYMGSWAPILLVLAFILIFVQIGIIFGTGSYRRGRGFIFGGYLGGGRGGGGSGGSGGGGGCACAGCACACACAGGGRAGCSLKDFYSTTDKEKEPDEIS